MRAHKRVQTHTCPSGTHRTGPVARRGTQGRCSEVQSVALPKSRGPAAVLRCRSGLFLNPLAPSDSHAACSPRLPGKFYATKIDVLEGTGRGGGGKRGAPSPPTGIPARARVQALPGIPKMVVSGRRWCRPPGKEDHGAMFTLDHERQALAGAAGLGDPPVAAPCACHPSEPTASKHRASEGREGVDTQVRSTGGHRPGAEGRASALQVPEASMLPGNAPQSHPQKMSPGLRSEHTLSSHGREACSCQVGLEGSEHGSHQRFRALQDLTAHQAPAKASSYYYHYFSLPGYSVQETSAWRE